MPDVTLTLTPEQALIIERALAGRLRGLEQASQRWLGAMSREVTAQAQANVGATLDAVRAALHPVEPAEPDWGLDSTAGPFPEGADPVTYAKAYHDWQARE